MTSTAPEIADPTRHPGTGRTVAEHLEHLDEQLRVVAAEEAADPSTTALDPTAWQVRASRRTEQRVALESERRFLAEFRYVSWTHPTAVATYARVARPIAARWARLTEERYVSSREGLPGNGFTPTIDLNSWMTALAALFKVLPQSDPLVRSILAREFTRWLDLRTAVTIALCQWKQNEVIACPEKDGVLPSWLTVGAVRRDLLRPDHELDES